MNDMNDEHVDDEFTNIALGDFGNQVDRLVEGIILCDQGIKQAIADEDQDMIDHVMAHLGQLIQGITIGALPTVLARFAHNVSLERAKADHVVEAINTFLPVVQDAVTEMAGTATAGSFEPLMRINEAIIDLHEDMDKVAVWTPVETEAPDGDA